MKVAIHQPEYLPWLGFFNKIAQSDIYVILNTAEFSHGDFHNRNQIKTNQKPIWLTIPISGSKMIPLNQIKIDNSKNWATKHWKAIYQNYYSTPHFKDISNFFEDLYLHQKHTLLVDLNLLIINYLIDYLNLKTKIILSSNINPVGKKTDLLIDICQKTNADIYLSGNGAKAYIDEKKIYNAKIKLVYQNFSHPQYHQKHGPFTPYMSTIDAICNIGRQKTVELINPLKND